MSFCNAFPPLACREVLLTGLVCSLSGDTREAAVQDVVSAGARQLATPPNDQTSGPLALAEQTMSLMSEVRSCCEAHVGAWVGSTSCMAHCPSCCKVHVESLLSMRLAAGLAGARLVLLRLAALLLAAVAGRTSAPISVHAVAVDSDPPLAGGVAETVLPLLSAPLAAFLALNLGLANPSESLRSFVAVDPSALVMQTLCVFAAVVATPSCRVAFIGTLFVMSTWKRNQLGTR